MHKPGLLVFLFLTFFIKIHAQQNVDSLMELRQDTYVIYDSSKTDLREPGKGELLRAFRASEDLISVDNYLINYQLKKELAVIDSMNILMQSFKSDNSQYSKTSSHYRNLFTLVVPVGIGMAVLLVILGFIVLRRRYLTMILRNERLQHNEVVSEYRKKLTELQVELDQATLRSKEYHEALAKYRIDAISSKSANNP